MVIIRILSWTRRTRGRCLKTSRTRNLEKNVQRSWNLETQITISPFSLHNVHAQRCWLLVLAASWIRLTKNSKLHEASHSPRFALWGEIMRKREYNIAFRDASELSQESKEYTKLKGEGKSGAVWLAIKFHVPRFLQLFNFPELFFFFHIFCFVHFSFSGTLSRHFTARQ